MAKYNISLLIPGIRPHNWVELHETVRQACKHYSFEIIFIGPFPPPQPMENVQFIQSYRCPSSAAQLGAQSVQGEFILHSVDDAKFVPDSVDQAMELYKPFNDRKTVINMRYTEGVNYSGAELPLSYWFAHSHPPMQLVGIPCDYKIALHFLMDYAYFKELGGFDCSYEYQNFNLHDLMFRIQYDGGKIYDSATTVTNCNLYVQRAMDHGPIEDAYVDDMLIFANKYGKADALQTHPVRMPFDNWQQQPEVWQRRFGQKLCTTYEELL